MSTAEQKGAGYDERCAELARVFLADLNRHGETWKLVEELATEIQRTIEGFIAAHLADRMVTVCSACRQASCWQGIFYCDDYQTAGTVDMPVSELERLALEHPSYWQEPADGR